MVKTVTVSKYPQFRLLLFAVVGLWFLAATASAEVIVLRVDGDAGDYISPHGNADGSGWGSSAFVYLQDALETADLLLTIDPSDEVEIWVAAASTPYKPDECSTCDGGDPGGSDDQTASFFMLNDCRIYGGFEGDETTLSQRDPASNVTILSGDLDGDDSFTPGNEGDPHVYANYDENSHHVVRAGVIFVSSVDATALIDGFSIVSGAGVGLGFSSCGGGVLMQESSPIISRCIISRNFASWGGGLCASAESHPYVTNCVFTDNMGNDDGGGAAAHFQSDPVFMNCTFYRNKSGRYGGGGLALVEKNFPQVLNCTFHANEVTGESPLSTGGAISCDQGLLEGTVLISNTIMWGNIPGELFKPQDEDCDDFDYCYDVELRNCIIEGDVPSNPYIIDVTGNLDVDPEFVDAANGDLRLEWNSPAINTGDQTLRPVDAADLDGDANLGELTPLDLDLGTRYIGLDIEMGAYEFQVNCGDANLDEDCDVDGVDQGILLNQWTGTSTYSPCSPRRSGDLNNDCKVNASDLAIMYLNWGPCNCVESFGGGSFGEYEDDPPFSEEMLAWLAEADIGELWAWFYWMYGMYPDEME